MFKLKMGCRVQRSGLKKPADRSYLSVSLNGVGRVYFEVGSGNRKTGFGVEGFGRISDNLQQYPSVATYETRMKHSFRQDLQD